MAENREEIAEKKKDINHKRRGKKRKREREIIAIEGEEIR